MESEEKSQLSRQSTILRQELKAWEREYAAENNGQKADREIVKSSFPAIAAKYKEYNRIRDKLSGKLPTNARVPSSPRDRRSRKRKSEEEPKAQTPPKRRHITQTPTSKRTIDIAAVDPYYSPSVIRKLFSPAKRTTIGPTPQKDGRVLGLFDLLLGSDGKSPSTSRIQQSPQKHGAPLSIYKTPGKPKPDAAAALGLETPGRHSRTPASVGKRFMLDKFATPLKRRHPNEVPTRTPTSASKLHFSTPAFLRRDSQRTAPAPMGEHDNDNDNKTGNEDGDNGGGASAFSPHLARLPKPPRRPPVRGLSSMLAALRRMEDEAADDDLDALREAEANELGGGGGGDAAAAKTESKGSETGPKKNPTGDDGRRRLLDGFDDEGMYDSDADEGREQRPAQLGRDGKPLGAWKKRGQKRTTRRVAMKPVKRARPAGPPAGAVDAHDDGRDEDDGDGDGDGALALAPREHGLPDPRAPAPDRADGGADGGAHPAREGRNFASDDGGSESEYTASEGGSRTRRPDQDRAARKRQLGAKARATGLTKANALAHANFKRLKIRGSSGAKAGPGVGSRFRRRRK